MDYIEREKVLKIIGDIMSDCKVSHKHRALNRNIKQIPSSDVIKLRRDFNVGDFCLYGLTYVKQPIVSAIAIVEIVKILDDERGVAELKFHKIIIDNTGNEYFQYIYKSGRTTNGSFKYLMNITPKLEKYNG